LNAVAVRDLDLDLDAFEGPFDLLLTLVLKDEVELADVEVAGVVMAFLTAKSAAHFPRTEQELELAGEFLVLIAGLLELKARGLFPDEDELAFDDLDPEEAAGELAERLALYRRFKAAAGWLEERLAAESDRYFRLGPAPLAPVPDRPLAPQDPAALGLALRLLAAEPPAPSLNHLELRFPPVSLFLDRFRAVLRRRRQFVFDREVDTLSRVEQAVAFLALLELRKAGEIKLGQPAPFEPITVWSAA
jgi:segregation and condensation protein A